jgi:DNA-binding NtrC family response regulator
VVDDDADLRRISTQVLSRFGYQTEFASDGETAWKALQRKGYDLLIAENDLPAVPGVELVKKLRVARMTLPVILASGDLPSLELSRNTWLHPIAGLAKPLSIDQLLETVENVLERPTP